MHHFTPETENVEFNEVTKNDFMAAINILNRLNCYKSYRKYQTSHDLLYISHQSESANVDHIIIS